LQMVSISFLMVLDVGLILIYLFLTVTCASVADYTHCTTQIHMAVRQHTPRKQAQALR